MSLDDHRMKRMKQIKETTEYAECAEIYNSSREGQEKKFLYLFVLSAVKSKKKYVPLQSILLENIFYKVFKMLKLKSCYP